MVLVESEGFSFRRRRMESKGRHDVLPQSGSRTVDSSGTDGGVERISHVRNAPHNKDRAAPAIRSEVRSGAFSNAIERLA